jgi:mannose-6-phosphate isomerase-like protein (cupin superfamily)
MVFDGETTLTFLAEDGEQSSRLRAGDLVVVPQGTWHRFETPDGVKVLSVTPQPTDHRTDRPG